MGLQDFRADLHIHSRFSRATSSKLNVPVLAGWAALKGLQVLGTGDFTHPAWRAELGEHLEYEEASGLYKIKRPGDIAAYFADMPELLKSPLLMRAAGQTRFMPQAEISSIYKRGGKVRKVHNLVFMPTLEAAEKLSLRLEQIGNLHSDGRPILGLDSRDLLELVLETDPQAYLVPAHIWTPWFSLFGSKSGFDRIEDCFADLSSHIFALETGLSSDPEMNRCLSALDQYKLISNSDAHSGENLAREANIFSGEMSYSGIFGALKAKRQQGLPTRFMGTYEFFPDEGKYHLDGHRACGVVLTPEETRANNGICPVCGKPLTVGVLYRVRELADRAQPEYGPDDAFTSLIPLPELLGEVLGAGSKSVKVSRLYQELLGEMGSELDILLGHAPEDIARHSEALAEGVRRMRAGTVIRKGGYDGEFGVISVFTPEERRELKGVGRSSGHTGGTANMLPGFAAPEPKGKEKPARKAKAKEVVALGQAVLSGGAQQTQPATGACASAQPVAGQTLAPARASIENARAGQPAAPVQALAAGEAARAGQGVAPDAKPAARLNERQLKAAQAGPGPVLTLAGPGTGKTHTLVERIHRLVAEGVPSKRILALTFTRRAAQELDERLRALLAPSHGATGEGGQEPAKAALPRTDTLHALALEFWHRVQGESPVLLNEESALRVFAESNSTEPAYKRKEAWSVINLCREKRQPLPEEFQPFYKRYTAHKDAWNQADYTDLLEFWLSQAKGGLYAKHWDHIMVDEIQDLSPLQLDLIVAIAPEGGQGFFGIGDPNQSIYGFRGAHGRAAEYFGEVWPRLQTVYLQENFRSGARILHCAQKMFSAAPGVAGLKAMSQIAAEVHYFEASSAESEATWIAGQIRHYLGATSHTLMDSKKEKDTVLQGPYTPGDFAVLVRSRVLLHPIRRALERSGIPFSQPGADPFWHEPRVVKILQVAGRMLGISVPLPEKGEQKSALPECPDKVLVKGPDSMAAYWGNSDPFDSAFWHSKAFKDLCKAFEAHNGWPGLINWLGLQNELEQVRAMGEKVQLLTLHASKGLEFPIVFMPALEEGLLPFAGMDFLNGHPPMPEDVDEERRLFFVGITRAKEGLFLSHAQKRHIYAREHRLQPSSFLADLPLDMVKHSMLVAKTSSRVEQLKLF